MPSYATVFEMSDRWIGTEAAAAYVGIGKTKLYALSREGRIPAKRVGKKWMYDRSELTDWMQASQRLEDFFLYTPASIGDNPNLRDPQRDAYLQAASFFQDGGKKALIQIPVGCGKSGVVAILPFGIAEGRVLVIAPNLTIKKELFNTLDITNRQKCFWRATSCTGRPAHDERPLRVHTRHGEPLCLRQVAHRCHQHPAARDERGQMADSVPRGLLRPDHRR